MTTPDDPTADDAGTPSTAGAKPEDPILVRRAQIARLISIAMRTGYVLFGLFLVLIVVGFVTGFPGGVAQAATVCLIVGTLLLAPAMTFTYAVKAAEREDADGDWR